MINHAGFLAILDRGITLNWEDGPTLHKFSAAVQYQHPDSAASCMMRLSATNRYSDEPLSFTSLQDGLRAVWVWQERPPGWTAMLSVENESNQELLLNSLEVLRLDSEAGGLFNIGAPPRLWRCRIERAEGVSSLLPEPTSSLERQSVRDESVWESWSPHVVSGFVRSRELVVQPVCSSRSRPPAVMIRALRSAYDLATEIRLEATSERFERLIVRCKTDGMLLAPGGVTASPPFWIVAGDDAEELQHLPSELRESSADT
ncbi:MAG: hypothetical protein NZ693_03700 [Thermoflexales bacterium]|nr:hypothetical protein [Thermoflexales bacterium]